MSEPEVLLQAKKTFTPCHGPGGRFARCPGTPPPRRRHRRKYSDGDVCACPEGSEPVPSAKGRGFACSARTKEGARFVPMTCTSGQRASGEERALPSLFSPPAPKKSKAKRQKLDWSRCSCPPGSEKRVSTKGRTQCVKRGISGRAVFTKAVCPPGVDGLGGLRKRKR